jgi:hypothetical protein
MRRAVLALLLLTGTAGADEDPLIRVDVNPASVTVGEAVNVRITLLVPTWFPVPPDYPDFELANAITRLPPGASRPTSERIDGNTWSGVVRNYRIYPLTAASYAISGEHVRLVYANPGAEPIRRELEVPPISFDATVPAGAELLAPYIAGTSLELSLATEGAEGPLEIGSAVVLRYEARLDGLPAIFLPELAPVIDTPGASVYSAEPRVDDGPPATRREQVTLVFGAGGVFDVPAVELGYWNTSSSSVEIARVDGMSISVAGPPADDSETVSAPNRTWFRYAAAGIVALSLLALAGNRFIPRIRASRAEAAARRARSEAYAFRQLAKALQGGQADDAYAALLTWLDRLSPGLDSRSFARQYGNETLVADLDSLAAARFGHGETSRELARLALLLDAARQKYIAANRNATRPSLAPLNPA